MGSVKTSERLHPNLGSKKYVKPFLFYPFSFWIIGGGNGRGLMEETV